MGRILWYAAVTWDYIRQMLPGILLAAAVFFAVRPWRKKRLVRLELTSSPRREAALLLFAAFCAGLAALTLFPSGFWETFLRLGLSPEGEKRLAVLFPRVEFLAAIRRINWIPSFLLGKTLGAWSAYMVLANTLIFLPVGFFPALLWRQGSCRRSILAGLFASGSIEFLQLFVGRATDVDDVILNTAGAFLGWLFYLLSARLAPQFIRTFQVEVRHGRETGDPKPAPGTGAGQL